MSTSYTTIFRNQLNAIRKPNQSHQQVLDPVSLEDKILGNTELVTDPNDTPSEIRRSLEFDGPIDTEIEAKVKGRKHEEEVQENETSPGFRP
ncbi:hypothetical protein [Legionella micdadei]|uniref:Uncharacterized protein n=1 Tax=Legionella micdadei TaxID=451 RepID=A0A098GF15_LEGMI|nr:hypothetical protein [Legionella micdadei]KTD28351.1 hypothetical protein Lmic_1462 [Legionella micdadei]NSL16979.1 hypothetical protein [Legionella micdadei]CEG61059.1 conserved protein of unknown function [Legionella micdadei]SCY28983.1 hypothetical protein SAMN02982997_01272 [Legionella micdadei]